MKILLLGNEPGNEQKKTNKIEPVTRFTCKL